MSDHDLQINTPDGPVIVTITPLSEDAGPRADDVVDTLRENYEVER